MALAERWLLPDGVKEILPPQARQVEMLRRRLLDLYDNWGYEQVMPPLVEHLESLLTGVGKDLDINTYKLVDQTSGQALGLRADITPQVARIDAHRMTNQGANRLCYCGPVVHTLAENMLVSRNPLQLGAEIYGHAGIESDVEVVSLMLETMFACGIESELSLDLGHVDVYRGVVQQVGLNDQQLKRYHALVQNKALPELQEFIQALALPEQQAAMLSALPRLNGGIEVLALAQQQLAAAPQVVKDAISYLYRLADLIAARYPNIDLYFDLAELRGANYHTGVVFSALSPQFAQAIAKGGRYDEIGKDFGRSRAATGFSTDLVTLSDISENIQARAGVLAPAGEDAALLSEIARLRAQGVRVMQKLPGDVHETELCCDRVLEKQAGSWVITPRDHNLKLKN
ncbi:MAG: ATP phosphoribosyltransferase regulatory subunit [Pseudomonadales bacterium]|nr:ATP phosphoribosyltransferase regulatory subunit [Pseudomonadales bacterium]NRA16778.1 ATP phosphoribosyltransferase regulatory subunit [Oceanospirillaceae bacterium]